MSAPTRSTAAMQVSVVRRAMLFAGTSHPRLAATTEGDLGIDLSPLEISGSHQRPYFAYAR